MGHGKKRDAIRMPEYGRCIQDMVTYATQVADREQRNQLAELIVQTMKGLNPKDSADTSESNSIYWDHLAIISDFTLDVDYPQDVITQERLSKSIEKPAYTNHKIHYGYYGHIIERMIDQACGMPPGDERTALEYFIALQMKRGYMTWNSDVVDDQKIFQDLYTLSNGRILLTPENCKIILNPNTIERSAKQKAVKKKANKQQGKARIAKAYK